jgi:hypothetical protein
MKPLSLAIPCLLALAALSGCASSDVEARRSYVSDDELIQRPGRIIVHNIAATPGDIAGDSATAGRYDTREAPQTDEEIALGRELGDRVAAKLVEEILAMKMPAERAGSGPPPNVGDLVIKGEFVTIDEGSRVKRMLIGFGAGAAELKTFVEGYQVTATGLRPLGSAEIEAGGGHMPGMLVPVGVGAAAGRPGTSAAISGGLNVAKELGPESLDGAAERTAEEIAKVLKEGFKKRGWIKD